MVRICGILIAALLVAVPVAGEARNDRAALGAIAVQPTHVQQLPVRIYLIRGLANIFSLGMDDLAAKLAARGHKVSLHGHGDSAAIIADIVANGGNRRPFALIGHSLGADTTVTVSNALWQQHVSVPLIVMFDPVTRMAVPGNVRRAVNLYQSNNGWGTAMGQHDAGRRRGVVQNIDLGNKQDINHFNIDKDARLHANVMAMVEALGRAARPRSAQQRKAPEPLLQN